MTDTTTGGASALASPVALPTAVGQATVIEQSRAVAEVQSAVIVAQQVPRNFAAARLELRVVCESPTVADTAFYRFKRGDTNITGPTVKLAREVGLAWGNMHFGVNELDRDDTTRRSQMQAWAWDIQRNVRSSSTFIVPHKRDKKGGPVPLVELRDIYENNANAAGRRLREAIFGVVPNYFVAEAADLCRQTLGKTGGKTHEERVESAANIFDKMGVDLARLEQKLGRPADKWDPYDLANLRVTHASIQRGEVTADDEFPHRRVTATEIEADATQAKQDRAAAPDVNETASERAARPDPGCGLPGSGQPAPAGNEPTDLRATLKKAKLTVGRALEVARENHPDDSFANLDDVIENGAAFVTVLDWIDQQGETS